MTQDLHKTTQELIKDIERKDRRFRMAQSLFMVVIMLVLAGIIFAQFQTLQRVQDQLEGQKGIIQEFKNAEDEQSSKIIRRLDCMVTFFSTPDRQNLTIEDIDRCALNRDEDTRQFFREPEETPAENPPNLPDSASSETSENGEAQGPRPEQPTPNPQPWPPVEIFGVPVCVSFSNICVRQ